MRIGRKATDWFLLDHLVRPDEDRLRNREAQGLGGLEVDHQLELGRLLHGEVGGFGPLQDLVHQRGGLTELLGQVFPIGQEAPSIGEDTIPGDYGKSWLQRELTQPPRGARTAETCRSAGRRPLLGLR